VADPPSIPARGRLKDPCKPSQARRRLHRAAVVRTRDKNHYPCRRREENAARDSNFRKVIEFGPARVVGAVPGRCRLARAPRREPGAGSAPCYGGRRNATAFLSPRCPGVGQTGHRALQPPSSRERRSQECGAALWRRNTTGATPAIAFRRSRCCRGSTARRATAPSAGLPAADGECGANLWRLGRGRSSLRRRHAAGSAPPKRPRGWRRPPAPRLPEASRALHSDAATAPGWIHINW
jgi:hypothetical protein